VPMVREHLLRHAQQGGQGLMFPSARGEHLRTSAIGRWYYPAREAAGRPDLRFHDLRRTGAVLAAQSGATLAELMHRLGHTPLRSGDALPARRSGARPRDSPTYVAALPGTRAGETIGLHLTSVFHGGTAARIGDNDSVVPWGAAGEDVHHAQALSEGVPTERGRGGSRS
jgi:hypothetical protein